MPKYYIDYSQGCLTLYLEYRFILFVYICNPTPENFHLKFSMFENQWDL